MKTKKRSGKPAACLLLCLLMIVSVGFLAKAAFGILGQKRDNPVYFSDCLSPNYDPEKSQTVKEEVNTLAEKVLTYSLMKNDLSLFENSPYVMSEIEAIRKDTERNIADTVYFTEEKIKTDSLDSETVENGFAVLSDKETDGAAVHFEGNLQYARTDKEQIEEYFEKEYDRRSEETKLNLSTAYRESKEYLESLESVEYCVISQNNEVKSDGYNSVQVNTSTAKTVKITNSADGSLTVNLSTALSDFSTDSLKQAMKEFTGPYEFSLVFGGSMLFNENLKNTDKLHNECRSLIISLIIKTVLSALTAVASGIAFVILFPVTKRKKSGIVPAVIVAAVSVAAVCLAAWMLSDSVKLFMDPTIGTAWIKIDSDTIVTKACIRSALAATGVFGFAASVKAAVLSRKISEPGDDTQPV
ncbi:MAG: hypothetical protein ACI4XE_07780 [Acutalibacteraceae bacterium]